MCVCKYTLQSTNTYYKLCKCVMASFEKDILQRPDALVTIAIPPAAGFAKALELPRRVAVGKPLRAPKRYLCAVSLCMPRTFLPRERRIHNGNYTSPEELSCFPNASLLLAILLCLYLIPHRTHVYTKDINTLDFRPATSCRATIVSELSREHHAEHLHHLFNDHPILNKSAKFHFFFHA